MSTYYVTGTKLTAGAPTYTLTSDNLFIVQGGELIADSTFDALLLVTIHTITSLLAWQGDTVVGCGTIVRDKLSWSPHVGEIRMVISTGIRGLGVGRALSQETFALALSSGLEKLVVQMTVGTAF